MINMGQWGGIDKDEIIKAAKQGGNSLPGIYHLPNGKKVNGNRISDLPAALRALRGYRNVSDFKDEHTLRKLGVEVVEGRYLGKSRSCLVVVINYVK